MMRSFCSKKFFSTTTVETASHFLGESKAQKARKLRKELLQVNSTQVAAKGSLIADTLRQMEEDESFKLTLNRLKETGQAKLTNEERKLRRRALDGLGVKSFDSFLKQNNVPLLERKSCEVFQINIGLYCNQACNHCHVESSPRRKQEQMSRETVDRCLQIIEKSPSVKIVDITGGAPELNEHFFYLAKEARNMGKVVIDRCNLTVLSEPGMEKLPEFLSTNQIQVVASLPCYSEKNVDLQRGRNVFNRSIVGLQKLNEVGYGTEPHLKLDLVYNPLGPFLPPQQQSLEAKYKEELLNNFGIIFNNLFTLTNMPIKRFADMLVQRGELKDYMELLVKNFNPKACEAAMCINYLSVDWEGNFYDCDFNQQLKMNLLSDDIIEGHPKQVRKSLTVFDVKNTDELIRRKILTSNHCFGCVSGAGSSCQGATV